MEQTQSVADPAQYPGTVLEPNTPVVDFSTNQSDTLQQFGTEMDRPNAVESAPKEVRDDRYTYWQSEASKKENKIAELEQKLAQRAKFDPLVDLLRTDEEAYRMLQSRLTGARQSSEKPMEMPQKPDNYSEVEAYSNVESPSFKYRKDVENYKDYMLNTLAKQNQMLFQQREQEKAEAEKQYAQREALNKFKNDVVSKGIADAEFAEFFNLVNNASQDDMVSYFKWKKSQQQPMQDFNYPPSVSAPAQYRKSNTTNFDIGKEMLDFARINM